VILPDHFDCGAGFNLGGHFFPDGAERHAGGPARPSFAFYHERKVATSPFRNKHILSHSIRLRRAREK
jgi:hypothetical protein